MNHYRFLGGAAMAWIGLGLGGGSLMAADDDTASQMKAMQERMMRFEEAIRDRDMRIQQLEKKVETLSIGPRPQRDAEAAASELDRALREAGLSTEAAKPASSDIFSKRIGGANLRLIDVSIDILMAAGGSTERDASLGNLQGGGHDPRKRGFTLQNAELSLMAAVDPYFTAEAHIVYFIDPIEGETVVELEEAFATTSNLPWGLQVEAGHFFTEFGRMNPRHPHQWNWLDAPVINTRLFGPDGMRGTGFRLGWLTPLPWFSELHFGVQNAGGETMSSFLANDEFFTERAIGGLAFEDRDVRASEDLVYLLRWHNSWEVTDELTASIGVSGLMGPNASGPDGDTLIYGGDFLLKWRPKQNERGWPFVAWQTEIMKREYGVDRSNAAFITGELEDWGLYSELLVGFTQGWAAGVRYDYATGSGDSVGGRDADPFRDDRHRISPILIWQITEFSRLRLQYNFDEADHLESGHAHSIWFGLEVMFGAHPAHTY